MGKIPDGCILLARKLQESEIWEDKPAWWLKVWIYLIMEVNFADTRKYKRGQGFFRMNKIHEDCHLYNDNIKVRSLTNLLQWLKKMTQIKTQKMTHGMVITICNYEEYQDILHYRNDTVNETDNQNEMTRKRHRNDTIIDKNANKNAKETDILSSEQGEEKKSNKESKPTSTQEVKTAPDESGNPEQRVEAKGRQTRKKTTDPRVKQFIDFAFQEHKKKFGQPLFITPGKDGELVKELLKTFELSFLKELYVDLINSDDQFFQKVGYGINVFYPSINKLAANHGKPNRGRKPLTSEELVEDFLKREEAKNGRV